MSRKVVMYAALAALMATYLWDVTRPYVPKHKANECFIVVIPPQAEGENPLPIAVVIEALTDKQEYQGTMYVGFVMPSPLLAPAKVFDKELADLNAVQVNCEDGEPPQQ